jgi:DNA replication initiation complex subunit (GINS family)
MGIFGNILGKIFGHKPKKAPAPAPTPQAQPTPTAPTTQAAPAPAQQPVDIEAVLEDMAQDNPQKLNWRTSIVDLMKLVGMESSLQERKDLADELGYTGDKSDSASMNIWLHKAVLKKLSENGGKVPASMLD